MDGAELPGGVEAGGGGGVGGHPGRVLPLEDCVFCPPPFAVEAFVWPLVCATRAMAMD